MGIVIDRSVLIAAERGRLQLAEFSAAHPDESFFITAITAAELLHGVERAQPAPRRAKRAALIEKFLSALPVLDYDLTLARRHAELWAKLAVKGKLIGPYDMIIAASALEYGHSLATLNVTEFRMVPGLRLVDVAAYLDRQRR
jgi:tRNA(fMet)-specific endonuclease VapC